MPVYQYHDTRTNCTVELCRPIAERDLVPAELRRITVPARVVVMGSSSNPHDADSQVPKAFRALEQKVPAREIARESGFSVDQIKRVWGM